MDELTKYKFFAEHFDYCRESGEFTRKSDGKVPPNDLCNNGYKRLRKVFKGKTYRVRQHRLAWYIVNGNIPDKVDHKNGDKLLNSIRNLRDCTATENSRNRKLGSNSTTGFKGVVLRARSKRNPYEASIKLADKKNQTYLGSFPTAIDAAIAYDKAAKEHFGEFANVNFPCLG